MSPRTPTIPPPSARSTSPARPSRGRVRRPPAQGSRSGAAALGMDERFRARRQAVLDAGVRHRRRLAGSVAALVVLAGLAAALTYSPLFDVTDVRVAGVEGERAVEVVEAAGFAPGEHLLFADLAGATARVEALPWIADAAVNRVPPSTLEVGVRVREPMAVVRLANASWLVDGEGVLIGGGAAEGLVTVDARGAVLGSVGHPVADEAVRDALAAHAALPAELRDRVLRYEAGADAPLRLLLRLDGEPAQLWVRMGNATRSAEKSQAIRLVIAQAQRDDAVQLVGVELDVRAPERPVLVPVG